MRNTSSLKADRFVRSKQSLEILTKNDCFQEKLKDLRKKHGIPLEGFKSESESITWHENLYGKLDNTPQDQPSALENDIELLMNEYKLPNNLDTSLEFLIKFNKIMAPESVGILLPYNEKLKRRQLFLEIFPETTIDDIKIIWPRIMRFKKKLVGYKLNSRFRKIPTLKLQESAYKKKLSGMKLSDIANEIEKESGKTLGYEDVGSMLTRYKKKVKTK